MGCEKLPLPRPAAVYARKAGQQAELLRQQRRQEQEDLKKKKKFTGNQKVGWVVRGECMASAINRFLGRMLQHMGRAVVVCSISSTTQNVH